MNPSRCTINSSAIVRGREASQSRRIRPPVPGNLAAARHLVPKVATWFADRMFFKPILMVAAIGLLIAGCSGSGSKPAAAAADVPVNLVFSGGIRGTMTTATGALKAGTSNPTNDLSNLPADTQCSTFTDSGLGKDFVASVNGIVAGKHVKLSIEVNGDNPAFSTPGTALKPALLNQAW